MKSLLILNLLLAIVLTIAKRYNRSSLTSLINNINLKRIGLNGGAKPLSSTQIIEQIREKIAGFQLTH